MMDNSTSANKPLAIMTVEVITQAFVLRKNSSDYPHCRELETATIASAKTLAVTRETASKKSKSD